MDGEIRRREIVKRLRETEKPISATRFAKAFDVSRQIIVGDVALLRATGVEIVATARGYMLEQPLEGIDGKLLVNIHLNKREKNCQSLLPKVEKW